MMDPTLPPDYNYRKSAPYQIGMLVWADAHAGEGGWQELAELEDDGECLVTTVGFIVPPAEGGKEGHITLWQTINDGEGINPFHVPLGMVRSLKIISE